MTPPIPLACAALALAFATPAFAQDARPPVTGQLAAPDTGAYLGALDDFGARVDVDGVLLVTCDPLGLTASVVNLDDVAFEASDLLSLPGQPVTNITHVFDVAIEGDVACVLVGVSNSTYHLLEFGRIDLFGTAGWVFDSSVDVTAVCLASPEVHVGFVDLVGDTALVTIDAGASDYWGRFTTSPLTFVPDTTGFGQLINTVGVALASMAAAEPPQDPGSGFQDAEQFFVWGGLEGFAPSDDLVAVTAAGTSVIPTVDFFVEDAGRDYGAAVALYDDLLFIGVPGDDTLGPDTGCVEVWWYDPDEFNHPYQKIDTIYSPRPQAGDRFGRSLDVSPDGTTLAIGELHNEAIPGATNGAGSIRLATIAPDDTVTVTHDVFAFASTVSVAGEDLGVDIAWAVDGLLVAGAPGTGVEGYAAWFTRPPAPWVEVDQSPGLAGTGGVVPQQVLEGAIFGDGALMLGVTDAKPLSTVYMVLGFSALSSPLKGGILYPSPDFLLPLPTNAAGELILQSLWLQSSVALGAFDALLQWWVVDAGGPVGLSATAGAVIHQY